MKAKNKGFGLIELMVSILVASIIVTGLYSLLTSSVVSFGFSSASSKTSQSARQINNLFETLVMQAGFINYKRAYSYQGFQKRDGGHFDKAKDWKENQFIYIYSPKTKSEPDELYVRFFGASISDDVAVASSDDDGDADGFVFDCRGDIVPNTQEMYLRFYVNNSDKGDKGDKGLICEQYSINNDGTYSDLQGPYLIDKSVVSLKFLVSSNTTTVNEKGFYAASDITEAFSESKIKDSAPAWNQVSMLKYGVVIAQGTGQKLAKTKSDIKELDIFTNSEFGNIGENSPITYTIKDEDRAKMHRVITGNISLVNKICLGGTGC